MESRGEPTPRPGPHDVTLDAPAPASSTNAEGLLLSSPSSVGDSYSPRQCFIEGSECPIDAGTKQLLRMRLRIVAIVVAAGFAVFLIYRCVFDPFNTWVAWALLGGHIAVTAVLALQAFSLCHKHLFKLSTLRLHELVIFGLPASYFALTEVVGTMRAIEACVPMQSMTPPWMMLIFSYAIFIPSSWQRATPFLASFAMAPLLVWTGLYLLAPGFSELPGATAVEFTFMALVMAITAVSGAIGVKTISAFRNEAFEARTVGQYRLKKLIGAGGMGEVYLAEHQLMKRPCAVKLIHPEKAGDPKVLQRFEREVRATAKLSHWNTVEIFDYGRTEDGVFFYVMEYLPGMNLADIVAENGPMPAERVSHFLSQTCEALGEAHDLGLVHRDIKPANLFSAVRGGYYDVTKLLDFGLAKPQATIGKGDLTQEGSITGSPSFIAPEQITGESEPDGRSDIYALGASAYYLLTGEAPFADKNPMRVLIAHVQQQPEPPSSIRDGIPQDLEAIIMRCLSKAPEDRYQTTREMLAALKECESAGVWTHDDAAAWWSGHEFINAAEEEPAELEAVV